MTVFAGLTPGVWNVDAAHSTVGFRVRHMMVSKVNGTFTGVTGSITVAEDGATSIEAAIDAATVNTHQAQRDEHIRSADFFDTANHPQILFRSTEISGSGEDVTVVGDLTIRGVTKPVTLTGSYFGVAEGPNGKVAGFEATGKIRRSDFGVSIQMPLADGGAVVGEEITLTLDIEAVAAQ